MNKILRSVSAVRIFVSDLERARRFYGGALGLEERAAEPGWVVFDGGGVDVIVEACAPGDAEGADLVGRFLAVSFSVEGGIDAAYQRLKERGVAFAGPPEKQPWGGTLAFARDPDGNVLTLAG
jgi:catechol 2,3-dioxygenase-like lactoylglutathione lyase family enzyme